MKKTGWILWILLGVLIFAACDKEAGVTHTTWDCEHEFKDATCTSPRICKFCGIKEGEGLCHIWEDPTCSRPKRCTRCRLIEGDAAEHTFVNRICTVCGLEGFSKGLEFTYDMDTGGYILTGLGTCGDTDIFIPDTYMNCPVIAVAQDALGAEQRILSVKLSKNIRYWESQSNPYLENIYCSEENGVFSSVDGILLRNDGTELVQYPAGRSGPYQIPEQIRSISAGAFLSCTGLTEVYIPDSVYKIGVEAFAYCTALESVRLPATISYISSSAFAYCSQLREVIWPEFLQIIDVAAFYGTALTQVVLPVTVTDIGVDAFGDLEVQRAQEVIHTEYQGLYYLGTEENPYLMVTGVANRELLNQCEIHQDTRYIGMNAFADTALLGNFVIPSQVTVIADSAFFGCSGLDSISIPVSVRFLGSAVFCGAYRINALHYCGTSKQWLAINMAADWSIGMLDTAYVICTDYILIITTF